MKLLYSQEYIERHLFVLEHEGKYIMVYRSSGLSGTGHGGKLLPFSGVDGEGRGLRSTPGYIYKEMFWNGGFNWHHKEIGDYENVSENMEIIDEFLNGFVPEKEEINYESFFSDEETVNYKGLLEYFSSVSNKLNSIISGMEPYDLQKLLEVQNLN